MIHPYDARKVLDVIELIKQINPGHFSWKGLEFVFQGSPFQQQAGSTLSERLAELIKLNTPTGSDESKDWNFEDFLRGKTEPLQETIFDVVKNYLDQFRNLDGASKDKGEASKSAKELDISSEEYRYYTYPDGSVNKFVNPDKLFITENGSHRLVTTDGEVHRPTPGWVCISWKPKPGSPDFVA